MRVSMSSNQSAILPLCWWEIVSALTRPYLKAHSKTLTGLTERLGELQGRNFDAIKVFAPCKGGVCYNGLELNFQPDACQLLVDLRSHTTGPLVDIWSNQAHPDGDTLNLRLPGYGYALHALPQTEHHNPCLY